MDFAQPARTEQSQQSQKIVLKSGPDFEEGPHSQIGEDEFYDAVENALDKFEEELEFRDKLKEIYECPSDIDLFTGGLAQDPPSHGLTGKVFLEMKRKLTLNLQIKMVYNGSFVFQKPSEL